MTKINFTERLPFIQSINNDIIDEILLAMNLNKSFKFTKYSEIKRCYDNIYKLAEKKLNKILFKFNSYQIAIEAFVQLEYWTPVMNNADFPLFVAEKEIMKIMESARYSWQYIIELVLTKYIYKRNELIKNLSSEIMQQILTYTIIMGYASSVSNELHYFPEFYQDDIYINYETILSFSLPSFANKQLKTKIKKMSRYLFEQPDFQKYINFLPTLENIEIKKRFDNLLRTHFNFDTDLLLHIFDVMDDMIKVFTIMINSYEMLVEQVANSIKESKSIIHNCLDFISFNPLKRDYEVRNFLTRNQEYRLINFASLLLPKTKRLRSLFDLSSSKNKYIINSKQYIIFSLYMSLDWINRFIYRVLNNKVTFLNLNPDIKKDVIQLQTYFHQDLFEKELLKEIEKKGYFTLFRLKKIGKKLIPCGEIDILCLNPKKNLLFIIEQKAFFGVIDIKSKKQLYNDYFGKSKHYHDKIKNKIKWVKENINLIKMEFVKKCRIPFDLSNVKIKGFNITFTSNYLKYIINDYTICRFDEFLANII